MAGNNFEDEDQNTDDDEKSQCISTNFTQGPSAYVCEFCDQFFAYKKVYKEHVDGHKKDENYIFVNREPRINQYDKMSSEVPESRSNALIPNANLQECNQSFVQVNITDKTESTIVVSKAETSEIKSHQVHRAKSHMKPKSKKNQKKIIGPSAYVCELCDKLFETKSSYNLHVNSVHTENLPNECRHCKKLFSNQSELKYHIEVVHERKKIQKCEFCGKAFVGVKSLGRHKKEVHDKQAKHNCYICEKRFKRPTLLRDHINSQHGKTNQQAKEKFNICKICDISFSTIGNLSSHVNEIHIGQFRERKLYRCTICDKSVTNSTSLKSHIKTLHQDKTNLKC